MSEKVVSLFLSAFFVTFVGAFMFPPGIGISLFCVALLTVLCMRLRRTAGWNLPDDPLNFLFAFLLAFVPAFRTNSLVQSVSGVTFAAYLLFLSLRCGAAGISVTVETLPRLCVVFGVQTLMRITEGIFNLVSLRWARIDRRVLAGLALSILPLIVFHSLFAAVNTHYARTVDAILNFVFNKEMIQRLAEFWIHYLLIRAVVSFTVPAEELPSPPEKRTQAVTISALPVLALFTIFSLFQGIEVAQAFDLDSFKGLSLYVQQGFWQLLAAAFLAFILWIVVFRRGSDYSKALSVAQILATFSLLLLCVCGFTGHKVALLQWAFGFKDQRLYATLAVILLSIGAVLGLLTVRTLLSSHAAGRVAVTASLVSITALAWINVDLLSSLVNPIRFAVNGKQSRDLSYLLGNSFDNVAAWEELMTEGISNGVAYPSNYYWGDFSPLCSTDYNGAKVLRAQERNESLVRKYSAEIDSPRQLGAFNVSELGAYHWLLSHRELTGKFWAVVRQSC